MLCKQKYSDFIQDFRANDLNLPSEKFLKSLKFDLKPSFFRPFTLVQTAFSKLVGLLVDYISSVDYLLAIGVAYHSA